MSRNGNPVLRSQTPGRQTSDIPSTNETSSTKPPPLSSRQRDRVGDITSSQNPRGQTANVARQSALNELRDARTGSA
jgi:hypothetical protein